MADREVWPITKTEYSLLLENVDIVLLIFDNICPDGNKSGW